MKFFFNCFILLFFILSVGISGQKIRKIEGQIIIDSKDMSPQSIKVTNLNTHSFTFPDLIGYFYILANLNDTLQFESASFENYKFVINQQSFNSKKIFIHLNTAVNKIDSVIINGLTFSGNLARDVKRNQNLLKSYQHEKLQRKLGFPTPKKVPEAENNNEIFPMIGKIPIPIALNISSLLNLITGRYRKTRDYRIYRDENKVFNTVEDYFGKNYFIDTLKIPPTEVRNFIMYVYYHSEMKELVAQKHFEILQVKLSDLALSYLKRLSKE